MTMLTGAVLSLRETDLERVLAWSTVVALGTLTVLIGLEDSLAATAAVVVLLVHALHKACLFLVAGIIEHETGTRDATRLRGLMRAMPLTAVAAALGALSMAGLPPFIGFVAKELVYEAKLGAAGLLPAVALAVNAAMVVVAGIVAARPFLGRPVPTPRAPHDPSAAMLAAPLLLALLGTAIGLMRWLIADGLVEPAAAAILGRPTEAKLVLWHGFTMVFYLSLATFAVGLALYLGWARVQPALAGISAFDRHGPDRLYAGALRGLARLATGLTRRIQAGSLRAYISVSLLVTFGGALAACRLSGIVAQLMAAGLVGFGVGVLFLALGAPDLAFTQFTVEVIAVVLILGVLARLPFRAPDQRRRGQWRRDAALAAFVGLVGTLVLLAVLSAPFDPQLPEWMGAAAVLFRRMRRESRA